MFLWGTKKVNKLFGVNEEFARHPNAVLLAKNQGLYNGFLAAGLAWSLFAASPFNRDLAIFFNGCVVVAAVYGGLTVKPRILWVQGTPALLGLLFLYLGL
ncbi:hypothetical protein HDU91_001685 [Kappamyces sp. JEL0680]|nr:hypothetical protein HDU91_001685 [Kappamyces sp. JEL0680]